MLIDETIDKWFKETVDKVNAEHRLDKPVYILCSSILPVAHTYCDAALLLLNNGKKLPAMALIRVLAELTFRFIWCLFPNKQSEDVNIRIPRWLKESYKQQKRNLKKLLPSADNQERDKIEAEIKYLEGEIEKIPYKFAGDLYGSLEDLTIEKPGDEGILLSWKNQLYPLLYTPFNRAIHPDLLLFSALMEQKGNVIIFSANSDKLDISVSGLKIYCMSCVFNIIAATRIVYSWDYQSIKQEYLKIKKAKSEIT